MILTREEIKELEALADKKQQLYGSDWGEVQLRFGNTTVSFWVLTKTGQAQYCNDETFITVPRKGWWAEFWGKEDKAFIKDKEDGPWWDDIRKGMEAKRKELDEKLQAVQDKRNSRVKDLRNTYQSK